jgi:hypothetical protein
MIRPFELRPCAECGKWMPRNLREKRGKMSLESQGEYNERKFCGYECVSKNKSDRVVDCPECGVTVAAAVLAEHRATPYCAVLCEARKATARGLIRCPSDAMFAMLREAGVPCEELATRAFENYEPIIHVRVDLEWWIPAIAEQIVQFDAPLEARMKALRKLASMPEFQRDSILGRTG